MEREEHEHPATQGGVASPSEGTETGLPKRESFSTMVSGRGAPPVPLEASLATGAAPPRPLVTSPLAPSPEDFADDTPASRPSLLTEQVGPSPPSSAGSVRLSLTGTGRNLRGVRVALVDTDPTRTDALAVALRARQAEVHITSFEGDRVRS